MTAPRTIEEYRAQLVSIPAGPFVRGNSTPAIFEELVCAGLREQYPDSDIRPPADMLRQMTEPHTPAREIFLDAYTIGRTAVTVGMWEEFAQAKGFALPPAPEFNPDWQYKEHPIVNITWSEARQFSLWAKLRLPTEAEWEKAARGLEGNLFPWSSTFNRSLVHGSDRPLGATHGTAPVGSFPTDCSPYGVLDLAGNVRDWCADRYDKHYYTTSPEQNPPGPKPGTYPAPKTGTLRVCRGGTWSDYYPISFLTFKRDARHPSARMGEVGFRLAC
ncbi:formylglycine-generating enzyme family protein [Armatimonas rosea]|uniref:Formylglycine-generating enzyme required for sulfatase activity n=1 Tax=Armatimonas rosea TaxID=685828 RepID=A0A7W9ST50_ARMRO|nr:SUMF1/EgtB/PvdO family nonheme iron enzyme [Armatimonas rosea]MBB6051538.1 formylglycine-generating enzyme required for sulfatase activity [Armatimonas rosea]